MATLLTRSGGFAYRTRGFAPHDRFVAEDVPVYEIGGSVGGGSGNGGSSERRDVVDAVEPDGEIAGSGDASADEPTRDDDASTRDDDADASRRECALAVAARSARPAASPSGASDSPSDPSRSDASRAVTERIAEGVALRLAADLIDGTRQAAADRAANVARLRRASGRAAGQAREPDTDADVAARLKSLARAGDRLLAEQLRLLVRFDDAALYRADGCRTMAMWMGVHMGLAPCTATERLRIGRALPELPVCESLFALGKLTFSQLRCIVRHASSANDAEFAAACAGLSIAATKAYCERFRHEADADEDAADGDAHGAERAAELAAMRAFERRFVRVLAIDAHSTRIEIELPNDLAADYLGALDHAEDWLRDAGDDEPPGAATGELPDAAPGATPGADAVAAEPPTAQQRRADAAVLIGRRSLAHAGEAVATADRYRVHVNVQAAELADRHADERADRHAAGRDDGRADTPCERPHLQGHGPLPRAVARRLAEAAGFTLYATDDEGQPVGSLRKAPPFTKRQLRAMRARDRCCQVPGCGSTRFLDGHHVVHRADGGGSAIEDGATVCGGCHRLLHEGGFRLERVSAGEVDARLGAGLGAEAGRDATGVRLSITARARVEKKLVAVQRYRLVGPDDPDRRRPDRADAHLQRQRQRQRQRRTFSVAKSLHG